MFKKYELEMFKLFLQVKQQMKPDSQEKITVPKITFTFVAVTYKIKSAKNFKMEKIKQNVYL